MATLTHSDKYCLSDLLLMHEGFVLDYSNKEFSELFREVLNIDIYSEKYALKGESKANRLRTFWEKEDNISVVKILREMLKRMEYQGALENSQKYHSVKKILNRIDEKAASENVDTSKIWKKDRIRIFISHKDKYKKEANALSTSLESIGVACFVAHDSIEPMKTFKHEIHKALITMDAMICFITEDFFESEWTNQEVGFALARDVPVYSYSFDGTDPEGFISDIQAVKKDIYSLKRLIKKDFSDYPIIKEDLLNSFIEARNSSFYNSKESFIEIVGMKFTNEEIERIVEAIIGQSRLSINQHCVLLCDAITSDQAKRIGYPDGTKYSEILENEILSQHSGNRFKIKYVDDDRAEIVDAMNTIATKA